MAGNTALGKAKEAKHDEFYTQITDIEKELSHYREHFKDKVVLCNCDDPYESNFFKYFAMNFNTLGLKKLICTCYAASPVAFKNLDDWFGDSPQKEKANELRQKKPYRVVIEAVNDFNGDGAIDLADVEYLLRNDANSLTILKGDGSFDSPESIECLKEADIVVTNPPFSLFRQYLALLMEHRKKFLIIGNQNALTYKEVFPLIRDNQVWLGYHNGDMSFRVPDTYESRATRFWIDDRGQKWRSLGTISWYTNLDYKERHEEILLYKKYDSETYPKYDNYDAIEVSRTADIPMDYNGVMGVPITFLDKYNPEQFEIIGMAKRGAGDPALKTRVYTKDDYPNYSDLNAGPVIMTNGVPKNTYPRILIRRRQSNGN